MAHRGNGPAVGQAAEALTVLSLIQAQRERGGELSQQDLLAALATLAEQQVRISCGILEQLAALNATGISAVPQPHLEPPPGSEHQDLPANRLPVAIPAGGSAVLVAWPAVRQKALGVVRRFGIVVTAGALADLRYSFRKNGRLFGYFEQMRGSAGTLEQPQEVLVELAPGDVFDVLAENTGAAAISVAARGTGWFWFPEEILP